MRLGLMPYYLQSYLNLAYEKIEAQKKESGRISNKDLQKKVSIHEFLLQRQVVSVLRDGACSYYLVGLLRCIKVVISCTIKV